jgi:hypothetical protein
MPEAAVGCAYVMGIAQKAAFACGSTVLYIFGRFFFRPAGRKKNLPKAKIRVLA